MVNFLSIGDIVDTYHLARLRGMAFVVDKIKWDKNSRTTSKWNKTECSQTDFWVLPSVLKRWNQKISGNPEQGYENHVYHKYLNGRCDLDMLSVGCGNSSHEQVFSHYSCFRSVEGIDISEKQLDKAKFYAEADQCRNLTYTLKDFERDTMRLKQYDVILFHSSLHHFKSISAITTHKIIPLLKIGGLLVICDYTGPNRLQWTREQLDRCNQILLQLPQKYRYWMNSRLHKIKVYRPGLIRMNISDPSEALDSESILDVLHQNFYVEEETMLGGNLLQPLLKGISQNFMTGVIECTRILEDIFRMEDEFMMKTGSSDFTFGVYRRQ